MNTTAPIVLFVYNRPDHTGQTIAALQKNSLASESLLYIFSDAPKTEKDIPAVQQVRSLIKGVTGFAAVNITKQENNQGLASSVIAGVTKIISEHGRAIVLEDDILTAPNFLQYMNLALNRYQTHQQVFSISGYCLPISIPESYQEEVFLSHRGSSWGWATWKDRWQSIDWQVKEREVFLKSNALQKIFNQGGEDLSPMLKKQLKGKIDSWAIRFAWHAANAGKYHVVPVISKVQNIGQDNSGTHSGKTDKYKVEIDHRNFIPNLPEELIFNKEINQSIYSFFKESKGVKVLKKIKQVFK